jgi:FkbM family methyltransferase
MANLVTKKGNTPICLFYVKNDVYISAAILENGRWEGETFDRVQALFEQHPNWDFLDIGSHVGNFALMAAKWGRNVLAVDSSFESICRLRRSNDLGQFTNPIVTVWNAIGDVYKTVSTKRYPQNFAAGYIVDVDKTTSFDDLQEPVRMIHLNDLLQVATFKTAIMKLDIEGYEGKALEHADKLFKKVDIPYVFMKWHILKRDETAANIVIEFFTTRGYTAANISDLRPLRTPYQDWPTTYCWVKISAA